MGLTDAVLTIITGTLSAGIIAWLFSSKEQQALTAERIKRIRSLSFKILVLCASIFMVLRCGYPFVQFINSEAPISRSEIVELFVYFANFWIFMIAATLFAVIWRSTSLDAVNKNPAEAGLGGRPRDAG